MSEVKQWGDPTIKIGDTVDISGLQEQSKKNRITIYQWIKCSDRLPDGNDDIYLVYNKWGEIHLSVYFPFNNSFFQNSVTHWMPLPSAPEDE